MATVDIQARIRRQEDGSLYGPRMERLALLLADDVELPSAWKLTGGSHETGSIKYRKKILAHPLFIERLEGLKAEKATLMADGERGEIRWMADQLYRKAIAVDDLGLIAKAVELRLKVMDPGAKPPEQGANSAANGPGKPAVDNPGAKRNAADIRRALITKGVKLQADAE